MTLNIGWIGCGRHATEMLMPQLGRNEMRLAAVCDVNGETAAAAAWKYGAGAIYSDYRALLDHPGLDAVCMAVGPDLHRVATLAALEKGLSVFIEKPPAKDLNGTYEIAAASQRTGKPVVVGFMKRFSSGNKIARNLLQEGGFGRVCGLTGSYMSGPAYFLSGSANYESFYLHHCVHYMDLIPWLIGAHFSEMAVRTIEMNPGHLLLHLNFECENGALGNIVMGTIQSRGTPTEAITIMGDHRRIEIDNVINVRYFRDPAFKASDPSATLGESADTLCWAPNFTAAANEDHKGYAALMAEAAKAFRGVENSAPDITDGVTAMASLKRMTNLVEDELRRRRK